MDPPGTWIRLSQNFFECSSDFGILNAVATDGSKILAAASKKRVYSQSRVDREMARVETILRETEEVDLAEDAEHAMGNSGRAIVVQWWQVNPTAV